MLPTKHFNKMWSVFLALLLGGVVAAPAFQLSGRPAAQWIETLDNSRRVSGLKIPEIVARLNLKPGMVVADIGSGPGVFSRPFAKAVAPNGKLYAVDIDPDLLSYVAERAQEENIQNIQTHLGEYDDAKLPGQVVDLAYMHDALHHIKNREVYLKNLGKYIKPDGRIAVIEFDINNPDTQHRDQPELLISKEEVKQWMAAAGFHPVVEFYLWPVPEKMWFVIFAR